MPLAATRGPSSYRGPGLGSTRTVPWAGWEGGGLQGAGFVRGTLSSLAGQMVSSLLWGLQDPQPTSRCL